MSVRLMAVGDIALCSKPDGLDPFELVAEALGRADLVFGNLEVALTSATKPVEEKAETLRAAVGQGRYLRSARLSVVNLANNHIGDFGAVGLRDTIETLRSLGIGFVGAGSAPADATQEIVRTVRGLEIAFVGFYSEGRTASSAGVSIAGMGRQLVVRRIAELAGRYRFVVVSLHWGIENVSYPSPEQQSLARACIDAGASVILGHHPHCLQGIETYRNRVIFYSLGNFNFTRCGDGSSSRCDLTAIADVTLGDDGSVAYDLIPARIGEDCRPRPLAEGAEAASLREHVKRISGILPEGIDEWWWFGEIAGPYLSGNLKAFGTRIRKYGPSHAIEMVRWLAGGFAIRCYLGIAQRPFRRRAVGGGGSAPRG